MIAGRQILFLVDQHFKMSEMDGGVYDTEHLFSIRMRGEKLHYFITTWDQVHAGLAKVPDESNLQALLLRNLRQCKPMDQDIAFYDRLPANDANKSYDYLMRCAGAVVERNRLHWYRDEMSRSIGGNWVNPAEKGSGKDKGQKGKGKSSSGNGDGGKGNKKNQRSKSKDGQKDGRSGSKGRSKLRDKSEDSRSGNTEVCKLHLRGKCKAG
jgi:hypothetical protein